ncbi:serine hydrolase [Acrocarpospora macrocephala]|uniref:6-aminohexanoate-dimer hydrolase n=1 Tax=Acrocarpospora macrocephala TaxID=150177 RepID=A0A5M3WKC0_9ACTN|nr:serine hydrolase [Acrocarpospora macrocephala]GES08830.1 6-aminohexanoate-dimer hydrolase [Acrocarpospora macrocephala]
MASVIAPHVADGGVVGAPDLMRGTPSPAHRLVTLDNWRRPPFNRWSFQHVRELMPSVAISRGTGPVWELPSKPADVLGSGAGSVREIVDRTYTDALVVLRDGEIIAEEYYQGMDSATKHLCMSVSKSLTSTLFGAAVGKGLIDPEALVTDTLPELGDTSYAGARWRHMLDMRTGTARLGDELYDQELQITGWQPITDTSLVPDIWPVYTGLPNVKEHGSEYDYRSFLTCLLGWGAERAAGMRHGELFSAWLWSLLGAEHEAEMTVDGHGNALSDVGLSATPRDLARFGELMRRGGLSGTGERVVPDSWVRDIVTPDPDSIDVFGQRGHFYLPLDGAYYRNQWWVAREGTRGGVYYASGIYGQMIMVHEPARMVVVKHSTWPEHWIDEFAQATIQGFIALGDQLAAE